MLEATHDGVRIELAGPRHVEANRLRRMGGLCLLAAALVACIGLIFGGVPQAGALALFAFALPATGLFAWGFDDQATLHVNQHLLRVERRGHLSCTIPLHDIEAVRTYEEHMVIVTKAGEVDLPMPGRALDDSSEVGALVEDQIARFAGAHGRSEAIPAALAELSSRREE